ncbi:MAG: hypothetical protein ACK4OJ_05045 [Brevundimonas sp.]
MVRVVTPDAGDANPVRLCQSEAMPMKPDRGSPLWGATPKHERLWPAAVRIAVWVAAGFTTWGLIAGAGWLIARAV